MELQMKNMLLSIKNALHGTYEPLESPDFDAIFDIVTKQAILPIVYEGCSVDAAFAEYKSSVGLMKRIYSILSVQSQRTEAFGELYEKLLQNGVKPLVLKGLFCRSLYGELCDHRPSGDEDIIIEARDFAKAKEILLDNGYILEDKYVAEKNIEKVQEVSFYNSQKRLRIELHLNFFSDSNSVLKKINGYFDDIFNDAVIFEINEKKYYTIEYTKNYIYLFFHIYKHFISSGVGLRPMIDLYMLEKVHGDLIDWDLVEKAIKDISAEALYGDILTIGNQYLGFELERRSEPVNTEMLIRDIENAGTFGSESEAQARSSAFYLTSVSYKGLKRYLRFLFPDLSYMQGHYTVLCDRPQLLPLYWIKRLVTGVCFLVKKDTVKSNSLTRKRSKLLKQYGIVE